MRALFNHSFLLQKQYVFVYRAIMELGQFGDTEIESGQLKSKWEAMSAGDAKKLEEEFERLANIVDDRKALSVGEFSFLSRLFVR